MYALNLCPTRDYYIKSISNNFRDRKYAYSKITEIFRGKNFSTNNRTQLSEFLRNRWYGLPSFYCKWHSVPIIFSCSKQLKVNDKRKYLKANSTIGLSNQSRPVYLCRMAYMISCLYPGSWPWTSKCEIALCQEWEGWLTLTEKGVNRSFMTISVVSD